MPINGYPLVESALVKANGILLTHCSILEYTSLMDQLISILDNHIGRLPARFRIQGAETTSSLSAATFDLGNDKSFSCEAFGRHDARRKAYVEAYLSSHGQEKPPLEGPKTKCAGMRTYRTPLHKTAELVHAHPHLAVDSTAGDARFSDSGAVLYACHFLGATTTVVM